MKAEVTPAPKESPIKKAMPSQFPLLERVKGKSAEQLKALEESFQRSSSPKDADLGKDLHLCPLVSAIHSVKSLTGLSCTFSYVNIGHCIRFEGVCWGFFAFYKSAVCNLITLTKLSRRLFSGWCQHDGDSINVFNELIFILQREREHNPRFKKKRKNPK